MAQKPDGSAARAPFVLGICGAPGSGKSAFARMLAECGAKVIDADAMAHEALEEEDVKKAVLHNWGKEAVTPDGKVNRAALGKMVFDDETELRKLEKLVHPRVRTKMMKRMADARREGAEVIALDVPLLLEAGLADWCDGVVFVEAADQVRMGRLMKRHGWDAEQAAKRDRAQMPIEEKRKKSDYTVNNNGSEEELRRQAKELYERLAGRRPNADR